jgi:hypothetical protein
MEPQDNNIPYVYSSIQDSTNPEMLEYAIKETVVDQAVALYKDKPVTNLQDYNDKFINLIQQLHNFYGNTEKLH